MRRTRRLACDAGGGATSLRAAAGRAGRAVDRERLLEALLERLGWWYGRFLEEGFGPVRERWRELSDALGRRVQVELPEGARLEGVAEDIDERGRLVVRPPDGGRAAGERADIEVVLTAIGEKKDQVIKAVRESTGVGLKDAKGLGEAVPKAVETGLPKEEAEKIQKQLEEAGASVELK